MRNMLRLNKENKITAAVPAEPASAPLSSDAFAWCDFERSASASFAAASSPTFFSILAPRSLQ